MAKRQLLGNERKRAVKELKELAKEVNLSKSNTERFIKFAIEWYKYDGQNLWDDEIYGYEWAERFKKNDEYPRSDYERLALLIKIDGISEAHRYFARSFSNPSKSMLAHIDELLKEAQKKGRSKGILRW